MDDTGKAKIAQDSSDDQHPYDSDDELCYKNICDEFPNTFEGFGYKFNESGTLLRRDVTRRDAMQEREHLKFYYKIPHDNHFTSALVTDYVYDLLEKESGLKKMTIPLDALEDEPTTFIFHSDDAFTNEKIVILIHGSGVVRAGQWARRLIINDSLNSGTQLPYIKRAKGLGYGIIVLNTNDNRKLVKGYSYRIRGTIVAHSYGGIVTVNTCRLFPESFQKRVFAIAFTDSPHSLINQGLSQPLIEWFRKVARNWVFSNLPLDTFLSTADSYEVECVSAGTQRHDLTSWMSFASVYEFIDARYRKTLTGNEL
ncbi:FAM172 family protein like [Argiope bruennichi]|uniref:FAM172 family protein like n=1 Tax=Argiope bruennichi TaxID=94029 RepID=A0A8T0FWP0_ARGBR|nr:FAM172 family protein like [Argiope bruennichi]